MANITCPGCQLVFDSSDATNRVTPFAVAGALGLAGASFGAGVGVATAGVGMAATVPLGAAGALIGVFGSKCFRRCPRCKRIFRV